MEGFADGVGIAAQFTEPTSLVLSSDGSTLFVADAGNHRIRRIDLATSGVSTIAGSDRGYADGVGASALFNRPHGLILVDNERSLIVADWGNNRIRRIDIDSRIMTTIAGGDPSYADGLGASARFAWPLGVCCHGSYLFIADAQNNRIRRVDSTTGVVSTFSGGESGYSDGPLSSALFDYPYNIVATTDGGTLFVSDSSNHRIRQIDVAASTVTTLAGGREGFADGVGVSAMFNEPSGLSLSDDGSTLIVGDSMNERIRCIDVVTKTVTTIAGGAEGFVVGPISSARFRNPLGVCVGPNREIYVCDNMNYCIRCIVHSIAPKSTVASFLLKELAAGSFCDTELISSDGVSVAVHGFILRMRCSILFDRRDVMNRASKKARSSKEASISSAEDSSAIKVHECEGPSLKRLVHFIYSDDLPELTDIYDALSLLKLVSALECPPSLRRLVKLCVSFIATRLTVQNVIQVLKGSLESNCIPLQRQCFSLLASKKPGGDLEFSRRLVEVLNSFPEALSLVIMVSVSGVYNPSPSIQEVQSREPSIRADLSTMWKRTCVVGEVGDEFGCAPDCIVTARGVSVAAHRFILSARSQYFKAALSTSPTGSYSEGASARIVLNFPEPSPSLPSVQALVRFIYVGWLTGDDWYVDAELALDLLHMTQSDDMGYFGIHDNALLRAQALRELKVHVTATNVFPLLRRATAMGQESARELLIDKIGDHRGGVFKDRQVWSAAVQEEPEICTWWSEKDESSLKSELFRTMRPGLW